MMTLFINTGLRGFDYRVSVIDVTTAEVTWDLVDDDDENSDSRLEARFSFDNNEQFDWRIEIIYSPQVNFSFSTNTLQQ